VDRYRHLEDRLVVDVDTGIGNITDDRGYERALLPYDPALAPVDEQGTEEEIMSRTRKEKRRARNASMVSRSLSVAGFDASWKMKMASGIHISAKQTHATIWRFLAHAMVR
jgi:hypothetical protein